MTLDYIKNDSELAVPGLNPGQRVRCLGSIDLAGIPGFEPGSKAPEALIIS